MAGESQAAIPSYLLLISPYSLPSLFPLYSFPIPSLFPLYLIPIPCDSLPIPSLFPPYASYSLRIPSYSFHIHTLSPP